MLRRAFFKTLFAAPFVGKALAAKYDRVVLSRGAATVLLPDGSISSPPKFGWAHDPDALSGYTSGNRITFTSGDK